MNGNPLFTIFTGTYNSEKVIDRLFESVKYQTFKDFEWIVIDDCSKDNTVKLLNDFLQEIPDISVTFIQHDVNTMVPTSRKEALAIARGKYFITWDHDDLQSEHQLEIFKTLWEKHDTDDIANIYGKINDQRGNLLGKKFPTEPYTSDFINLFHEYLVGKREDGSVVEHHVCVKTEKYKAALDYFENNPHLLNNRIPNGSDIWGTLAYLGYKTICTNQVLRTYYVFEEGRKTMSDVSRTKNAERVYRHQLLWVNYWQIKQKNKTLKSRLRNLVSAGMYGFLAKKSFQQIYRDLKPTKLKISFIFFSLPIYLLSKRYS